MRAGSGGGLNSGGAGFGGCVGKATMLRESHCERNHSYNGGTKAWTNGELAKDSAYACAVCAIYAQTEITCECKTDMCMTI